MDSIKVCCIAAMRDVEIATAPLGYMKVGIELNCPQCDRQWDRDIAEPSWWRPLETLSDEQVEVLPDGAIRIMEEIPTCAHGLARGDCDIEMCLKQWDEGAFSAMVARRKWDEATDGADEIWMEALKDVSSGELEARANRAKAALGIDLSPQEDTASLEEE